MVKIIFICKYNAFRSRIAEEYFKKLNKKVNAISRGFIMAGEADRMQIGISKKLLGVNIIKRKPMPVNLQELIDADKIIVVANDIPMRMFDYHLKNLKKKIVIWKIKDEQRQNKKNIKRIVLGIKRRVDNLNRSLK